MLYILNTNVSRQISYLVTLLKGSMNQKDWVMLVNHKHYSCRSWQYLYFEPRVVLYIRIVGTNNTVNKVSLLNYIQLITYTRLHVYVYMRACVFAYIRMYI